MIDVQAALERLVDSAKQSWHDIDELEVEAIRKALTPDTATSIDELDNMGPGSTILLRNETVYVLDGELEGWISPGLRGVIDSPEIQLPVRVLYRSES